MVWVALLSYSGTLIACCGISRIVSTKGARNSLGSPRVVFWSSGVSHPGFFPSSVLDHLVSQQYIVTCISQIGVKLPQTLPCGRVRSDCASSSHPEEAGVMGTTITQHASNEAITPQTDSCSGRIEADSYYITDANVGILGGEIAMNDTGNLSLRLNGGWLLQTGPPHRWYSDDMGSMGVLIIINSPQRCLKRYIEDG